MIQRARDRLARTIRWSERDDESRRSALLVGGITALVALAIAVVAVGLYIDRVAFRGETVLVVGDRSFNYGQLERRFNAEVGPLPPISAEQFGQLVSRTLALMEREELVRQAAAREGISAGEAEIEAQMKDELNLAQDASREELAGSLRQELLITGLELKEFEARAEAALLEERLRERLAVDVPEEAEQVDVRLLQVATAAAAEDALSQIEEGAELATLAATLSLHPSRSSAGEIGWVPRQALPEPVEVAAFALEAGEISDVIEAQGSFFILEVRGKETRPVDEEGRDLVVSQQLSMQLQATQDEVGSQTTITPAQLNRLAQSIQPSQSG